MPNVLSMKRRVSVKRYEPETLTYRDAITAAGSSISTSSLDAVELLFVRDCKQAGLWTKLLDVGVFAGANLTAALVKLKHVGQGSLINNNFVSGDFVETGATGGLTGDGATKYLNSGFNIANSLPDAAHVSFYLQTDVALTGNRALLGAISGGGHDYFLGSLSAAGSIDVRLGQQITASQAVGLTKGFYLGSRHAAASLKLFKNGSVSGANSTAVTHTKPSASMFVFGFNSAGSPGALIASRGSFYSIGQSFTDAEALAYYSLVQALQNRLGRGV
jgi:hypothetical protein